MRYLGFGFDIHGGGQDLIFPHHENEIAQAEAYYGSEPFVRFWMHNGLLTVRSEKMAKSLGNIILLRDALKVYGADVLKLFYLSTHYRSPLDYSPDRLKEHEKALKKLHETVKRVKEAMKTAKNLDTDASRKLFKGQKDSVRNFQMPWRKTSTRPERLERFLNLSRKSMQHLIPRLTPLVTVLLKVP